MSGAEPTVLSLWAELSKKKKKIHIPTNNNSFHHKSVGSSFKEKWNVDEAYSSKFDRRAENTTDKALSDFWMDDGIEQSAFLQNATKLFGKT